MYSKAMDSPLADGGIADTPLVPEAEDGSAELLDVSATRQVRHKFIKHWPWAVGATLLVALIVSAAVVIDHGAHRVPSARLDASEGLEAGGCIQAFQQCGGGNFAGGSCCGGCTCGDPNGGAGQYYKQCTPPQGTNVCGNGAAAPANVIASPTAAAPTVEPVTHCSADYADCSKTQCCNSALMTCFAKNPGYGICNKTCEEGHKDPYDGKKWSCKKMGDARIFKFDTEHCGFEWGDCTKSKCCKIPGMKCYAKDSTWSSCRPSCDKIALGGDPVKWSCDETGGSLPPTSLIQHIPSEVAGTSLFCVVAVMDGTIETKLVAVQQKLKLGIFACDGSAILKASSKPEGEEAQLTASTLVPKVFKEIWNDIRKDGQFLLHDWTVKADADAVFLPKRLRDHLENLGAPAGAQLYIKNSETNFGLLRPLMVFSKEALKAYFDKKDICEDEKNKMRGFSEPFYLMACMDIIGVHHMLDHTLLEDQYTGKHKWDENSSDMCKDQRFVAFHPYRQLAPWVLCYKKAMKATE